MGCPHAGYRRTGGFCTFNGLRITACALRHAGRLERVGIVDLDMHHGDGTDAIIDELGAASWVENTARASLAAMARFREAARTTRSARC